MPRFVIVDGEGANAFEVDEPLVHGDRVRNHGGLPICLRRVQTDLQGPALRQLLTNHYVNNETPRISEEPGH